MCSKPTSITNKLSENLPFYNCTEKIFYSLILKNTDNRKKLFLIQNKAEYYSMNSLFLNVVTMN